VTDIIKDQLQLLLPTTWNGIGFPVTNLTTNLSRDLVQHKYPGVDSARVEDMGRNPLQISATAVFCNSIQPAKTEAWKQGHLYPGVHAQFMLSVMKEKKPGVLVHPALGEIRCRVASFHSKIDANWRGGEVVDIEWIETIDDDNLYNTIDTLKDKVADAEATADQVDAEITRYHKPLSKLKLPTNLLDDIKAGIKAFLGAIRLVIKSINQADIFTQQWISKVSGAIGLCNALINAIHIANNGIFSRLKSLLFQLRATAKNFLRTSIIQLKRNTAVYHTTVKTTFTQLAQQLNANLNEMLGLNPKLLAFSYIPANSNVIYYTSGTHIRVGSPIG
jgi:prophage DNA circulation protein